MKNKKVKGIIMITSEDIKKLNIGPNDILVITLPEIELTVEKSLAEADSTQKLISEVLGIDNPGVMVLNKGMTLETAPLELLWDVINQRKTVLTVAIAEGMASYG